MEGPGAEDLFFTTVVAAHADGPDVVPRQWLVDLIEEQLAAPSCQYVLVTGGPGAGKTGLAAGLARRHPSWLRYFIRRDSQTSLTGADLQSFLLSVGQQLAATRPELFDPGRLEVIVRQRIGQVGPGGQAVGIRVEDLRVSPFYRTALDVQQSADQVHGILHGIEVGHLTVEPRLLEPDNLAHLALLDPAAALARAEPDARIVILVDALDELPHRDLDELEHRDGKGLLGWLDSGPELPPNILIICTARPHTGLRLLRARHADRLTELPIDTHHALVANDLTHYAGRLARQPAIVAALSAEKTDSAAFIQEVVSRAAGNFAYLAAYGRALAEAEGRHDSTTRRRLLQFTELPRGLDRLYAFFLDLLRVEVTRLGSLR